jgi:hypothetical protein
MGDDAGMGVWLLRVRKLRTERVSFYPGLINKEMVAFLGDDAGRLWKLLAPFDPILNLGKLRKTFRRTIAYHIN